jgi:hypothetical protein
MAYVIGLLTPEEEKKLESRGWELEEPPASLVPKDPTPGMRMRQIHIDVDMFEHLNCPRCCERHCEECGALEPKDDTSDSLFAPWHKDTCSLSPKNLVGSNG